MAIVFLLAMLVVPAVVARWLRHTRAWWLTGLVVVALGAWALIDANRAPVHHDDQAAVGGIGVAAELFIGVILIAYGAIVLGLCRHAYRVSHAFDVPR